MPQRHANPNQPILSFETITEAQPVPIRALATKGLHSGTATLKDILESKNKFRKVPLAIIMGLYRMTQAHFKFKSQAQLTKVNVVRLVQEVKLEVRQSFNRGQQRLSQAKSYRNETMTFLSDPGTEIGFATT